MGVYPSLSHSLPRGCPRIRNILLGPMQVTSFQCPFLVIDLSFSAACDFFFGGGWGVQGTTSTAIVQSSCAFGVDFGETLMVAVP